MSENRKFLRKIQTLAIYEVFLVGGPAHGQRSICSHDTVFWNEGDVRHRYERGPDDRYYYVYPAGTNPN